MNNAVHFLFRGLAAMQVPKIPQDATTNVFLPSGESHSNGGHHHATNGHSHECTLHVKMRHVNLDDITWPPESVATDAEGDQVGVWRIGPGSRLRISGLGPPSAGARSNGTAPAINLATFHDVNAATKIVTELPSGVTVVALHKGDTGYESNRRVCITRKGSEPKAETVANVHRWSTAASTKEAILVATTSGWMSIFPCVVKDKHKNEGEVMDAVVSITNIARVRHPLGLEHFGEYYSLISGVENADRASLGDCSDGIRAMDEPVWDCVPPVVLP